MGFLEGIDAQVHHLFHDQGHIVLPGEMPLRWLVLMLHHLRHEVDLEIHIPLKAQFLGETHDGCRVGISSLGQLTSGKIAQFPKVLYQIICNGTLCLRETLLLLQHPTQICHASSS